VNRRVDAALRIRDQGELPIPLVPFEKRPLFERYWKFVPTDDNIRYCFDELGADVGVLLDHLVVIDADSADGEKWFHEHVGQESPMVVRTVRGLHRWYRGRVKMMQLPGVDVRCGEHVANVFVPSTHPTGKPYEFLRQCPFAELPELPQLRFPRETYPREKLVMSSSLVSKKRESVRRYIARIFAISGQRGHNATFRAACRLRDAGLTEAEALEDLWAWNEAGNAEPPWTFREIEHKVKSAYERRR